MADPEVTEGWEYQLQFRRYDLKNNEWHWRPTDYDAFLHGDYPADRAWALEEARRIYEARKFEVRIVRRWVRRERTAWEEFSD